jgi:hypothetical protein
MNILFIYKFITQPKIEEDKINYYLEIGTDEQYINYSSPFDFIYKVIE